MVVVGNTSSSVSWRRSVLSLSMLGVGAVLPGPGAAWPDGVCAGPSVRASGVDGVAARSAGPLAALIPTKATETTRTAATPPPIISSLRRPPPPDGGGDPFPGTGSPPLRYPGVAPGPGGG